MSAALQSPAAALPDRHAARVPPLILVQVLRGLAATMVLVGHTQSNLALSAAQLGHGFWTIPRFAGGFGVDLFFCISGFIMVVSSGRFFASPGGSRQFLLRRIIRLVPLYWFFTLAYLPLLLAGRHGFAGNLPVALATSLSFIPYPAGAADADGVFPIYDLGWSLNYEMFFYVVFAAFMVLPRLPAVMGALAVLATSVLAGEIFQPTSAALSVWTAPILLEFGLGLVIGLIWLGAGSLPRWACPCLVVAATAVLIADPEGLLRKSLVGTTPNDFHRVLGWGLPAAAILSAATWFEKTHAVGGAVVSAFRRLGDASYSLYLVHPLVLLVLMKLSAVLLKPALLARLTMWPGLGLLFVAIALCAGLVTHVLIEKPLTKRLNAGLLGRVRETAI